MSAILTPEGIKSWPLAGWQPISQSFYPQRRGLDLLGLRNRASYETLYRTQPWVQTLVNKLSRGIARLPINTLSGVANVPESQDDSDLAQLFKYPWPRASAFNLKEAVVGSLALYGNSLCVPDFGDAVPWTRPPIAIWPIPWRYVGVIAGESEPIGAYIIQIGTVRRILLPQDVIHLMYWSPEGFIGQSPLEPLRTTLALEDATQRYSVASFANGARPSGAVRTDKPMSKPDRDALKAEIEATHGGVDNAFRIALLTHGLQWQPFSHSAVESELINQRKLNREEVCAIYDIAPSMVHIMERATHSNIDEQHRMLYQDSYAPWMMLFEEGFGVQMIERFQRWQGWSIRFDIDEVLRGNEEARSVAAQRRFQSAQMTPNELRADEGKAPALGSVLDNGELDPEHAANQVYIPVNMLPVNRVYDGIDLQQQPPDNAPSPGGEHPPTVAEQRSMIRDLHRAGYRISLDGEDVSQNGHQDHEPVLSG